MSKKDDALRLSLEALKQIDEAMPFPVAKLAQKVIREALADHPEQGCEFCSHHQYAGTKCKNCGREQPAQQKPLIGETNVELGFYSNDASNGQQRELVGKVEMGQLVGNRSHESASNPDAKREIAVITGVDEYGPMLNWYTHWVNFPIGTKLYTSPPASKPWVGLTDEEKSDLWCESTGRDCVNEDTHVFADSIEAKLREKNT